MKIKIFLDNGTISIVSVNGAADVNKIANKYNRWEYVV